MTQPMSEQDLHKRARRRVESRMGVYIHTLVFVCVNLGLFVWNVVQGDPRWHVLPLFGWGLGLAIHALVTAVSLRGDGLRRRMFDQEMRRLKAPR
jgi:hypothetical protein